MKKIVISSWLFLSLAVTAGYGDLPSCSQVPKTGAAAVCGYWWQKHDSVRYNSCLKCASEAEHIVSPQTLSAACNALLNPTDYSGPVTC